MKYLKAGDLYLNCESKQVFFNEQRIELPTLSYKLLFELMAAWPETLTQDELIARVWGSLHVQNTTLSQRVKLLRQSLKAVSDDLVFIEVERSNGYRFAREVQRCNVLPNHNGALNLLRVKRPWILTCFFMCVLAAAVLIIARSSKDETAEIQQAARHLHVLPFEADKQSINIKYLIDPLKYELVNLLGELKGLQINRSRVIKEQHSNGRRYTVSGKVSGRDNFVVVDIELTLQQEIIFVKQYQTNRNSLYFLKFDIAKDLLAHLPAVQQPTFISQPAKANVLNPQAYDLFLKAMNYFYRGNIESNRIASELVAQAYQISNQCFDIIQGYSQVLNEALLLGANVDEKKLNSLIDKLTELYPKHPAGYIELGKYYYLTGELTQARMVFEGVLIQHPEHIRALKGLAWVLIEQGGLSLADKHVEQITIFEPYSMEPALMRAGIALKQGNLNEATRQYKRILAVEPDNVMALNGITRLLLTSADIEQAKQQNKKTLGYSPNDAYALYYQSVIDIFEQHYAQVQTTAKRRLQTISNVRLVSKYQRLLGLIEQLESSGQPPSTSMIFQDNSL
ncbi:tetratricopeptide repeat protein [Pseudoalteromonas sp. S16_S37]|uniref:tetratricopeptide repeat protein n=1 Tax=Pseudoalteromonas sp. S16_S37 TaxID=2720228 RepID=UPI0016813EFE|nr:hypothetical protein [Pseudoalteromonas sp. S16_S37]